MLYNEKLIYDYHDIDCYYNQHLKFSSVFEAYMKEQLRFLILQFYAHLNKIHE